MYIIYCFNSKNPGGKSRWTNNNKMSLIPFFPYQTPKIKIFHMVTSKNPKVIKGGGEGLLLQTFLTLRRKPRIVTLIVMVLLCMNMMRLVQERRV